MGYYNNAIYFEMLYSLIHVGGVFPSVRIGTDFRPTLNLAIPSSCIVQRLRSFFLF